MRYLSREDFIGRDFVDSLDLLLSAVVFDADAHKSVIRFHVVN